MDEKQLAEIEARLRAATSGPWNDTSGYGDVSNITIYTPATNGLQAICYLYSEEYDLLNAPANASFIATPGRTSRRC